MDFKHPHMICLSLKKLLNYFILLHSFYLLNQINLKLKEIFKKWVTDYQIKFTYISKIILNNTLI